MNLTALLPAYEISSPLLFGASLYGVFLIHSLTSLIPRPLSRFSETLEFDLVSSIALRI